MTTKIVFPSPRSEKPSNASAASAKTISLDQMQRPPAAKRLANVLLHQYMTVKLVYWEADIILMAYILDKQRIYIGRGDPGLKQNLDIDLMGYGGRAKGVSRLHAILRRMGHVLSIVDLNSTNGTYHRQTPLLPGKPYFLLNGDEISFGDMPFQVQFGY